GKLADRLHRRHCARGADRAHFFLDRRAHQHAVARLRRRGESDPAVRAAAGRGSRLVNPGLADVRPHQHGAGMGRDVLAHPAVLGAPADIPVLTTYIFKLTNWSPPLYSTAAAVAIILMVVTGALVVLQQNVLAGRSFTTVSGKAFRPRVIELGSWRWLTFGL